MAKNKGFNAPLANTPEATAQDNDVLKGVEDDIFEDAPPADPGPEAPPADPGPEDEAPSIGDPSYPSYVLDGALAHTDAKLPHAAFKAAAAKYYPEQCVIIGYKINDVNTVVILDAGLRGRRKETIGA